MIKLEFQKTKGSYIILSTFIFITLELVFGLQPWRTIDDSILEQGWLMLLYAFPIINTIFMPLYCTIVASRICEIEHKDNMFMLLCQRIERGKFYNIKLIYGGLYVLFFIIIQLFGLIIWGKVIGFIGDVPIYYYGMYTLFTFVTSIVIYLLQYTLSILFCKQSISFIISISGTFLGLFSMFLSQSHIIGKCILWSYYGVFSFIGNNWSQETRINDFYFSGINYYPLIILIIIFIIIYFTGKKLFCIKEL